MNEFSALILQGDATAIAGLVVILAGLYLVVRLSGMLLKGALIVGVIVLIAVWIFRVRLKSSTQTDKEFGGDGRKQTFL